MKEADLRELMDAYEDWRLEDPTRNTRRELQLIRAIPELIAENRRLRQAVRYDPHEVYEVRAQADQKVYVSGSIDEIARKAFHEGYTRAEEDHKDKEERSS